MPIYRKGEDQSGLQKAAQEQAAVRKSTSAEERGQAGLGGGGQPYVSNLDIDTSSGTPKAFTKKYKGYGDKNPTKQYVTNVAISGLQVAERSEKMKEKGKLSSVKRIGNQKAGPYGTAGVIKGKVLREDKKTTAPKKRAASAKDTRAALKGGHITAEEAANLNKKLMTPSVKKKK
jgi:hypothetical protein